MNKTRSVLAYFDNYRNIETHHVIQTLSALAQETRLAIFRELVQAHSPCGDQTGLAAGELSERLGIPSPTLSFHLKEI